MNLQKYIAGDKSLSIFSISNHLIVDAPEEEHTFYNETIFHDRLRIEIRRTERSKNPFLLLLIDISDLMLNLPRKETFREIRAALIPSLREIDVRGWYRHNDTIGVICTDVFTDDKESADSMIRKVYTRFCEKINSEWIPKINISFYVFPEINAPSFHDKTLSVHLFPERNRQSPVNNLSPAFKRSRRYLLRRN